MPDLENRLPDLLRRTAAAGAPPDDRAGRSVLRRVRRVRALNASVAGLAAIALVAGTVIGARGLLRSDGTTIGDEGPTPSPSPSRGTVTLVLSLPGAVWPEVDQTSLETAQARGDAGELAWRLDPVETAAAFAKEIFGWRPADVQTRPIEAVPGAADIVVVPVSNAGLEPGVDAAGPPAPTTSVMLRQLGAKGDGGVWTVIGADSDLIATEPLPESIVAGSTIEVDAPVSDVQAEWSGVLALLSVDPTDGTARIFPGATTETIAGSVRVPDDALANVAVVARLFDPEGTTVAVDVVPIAVSPGVTGATGSSAPTGLAGPVEELPNAVLATRDAISIAAASRDFQALQALIDPDRFSYDFDDGSNPVPIWREDPSVLDTLVAILRMPFTTNREVYPDVAETSPTVYIWPWLMASDLADLSPDEKAMLEQLGITAQEVRDMLDAFGGYAGPRTGIAEDGTWLFYTIGGD